VLALPHAPQQDVNDPQAGKLAGKTPPVCGRVRRLDNSSCELVREWPAGEFFLHQR
jgi:hypothetical protein